jgi:hypothetical protein
MGVHICTRPNDPFTLEPKDSSMVDYPGNFIMLFNLGGPQPQKGGWCTIQVVSVLCVVIVLTMIVVGIDISAHDIC